MPNEKRVGYARVSTDDQQLHAQRLALADCTKVFEDTASGAKADRPGLKAALEYLRAGDTLVVWRLDRLGRNTHDLIAIVTELERRQINLQTLTGVQIDTTTAVGKLVFQIFAAFAEFEANQIRERTRAGLRAARARGRSGGRPAISEEKKADIRRLMADRENSPAWICKTLKISRSTLYRYAKEGSK